MAMNEIDRKARAAYLARIRRIQQAEIEVETRKEDVRQLILLEQLAQMAAWERQMAEKD